MFPSTITTGPRQFAYDFGWFNAHLSDAEWARVLPLVIAAPDMVAASIGRRDALAAK